jgi:putative flippase GtrA
MKKFIKFCFVGISNTAVTFCTFYILSEIFALNYLFSSFIGYVLGVVNSFILNKTWTFHDKNSRFILQFIRFSIVNTISLGINLTIMYVCVEKFFISSIMAQVIATGFTTIVNYLGSRALVFGLNNFNELNNPEFETIPELQKNK